MKKLVLFFAVACAVSFASCTGAKETEAAAEAQDSTVVEVVADSAAVVADSAAVVADSTVVAE